MRGTRNRRLLGRGLVGGALALAGLAGSGIARVPASAVGVPHGRASSAASGSKQVEYLGYRFEVPASWPIYRLGGRSAACASFDRHAVYLGIPGLAARCPIGVVGRTEAILVEPLTPVTVGGLRTVAAAGAAAGVRTWPRGSYGVVSVELPAAGVLVTASWGTDPALVSKILATAATVPGDAVADVRDVPAHAATHRLVASLAKPAYFKGLGFDECALPSVADISAWKSSPYRALNIYIGGRNEGCPQNDLTASWVTRVTKLGWSLIPTYVGLQAPKPNCPCATISPSKAYTEGEAAAAQAVSEMKALGIGPENPIYDDMEGYARGSTNSPAVLRFLKGWTEKLHDEKYISGVYAGADTGIVDLVGQYHSSKYLEPTDVWFADWNDEKSVDIGTIPTADWAKSQRIHQYNGGGDATYGGVTINVDGDDCDGGVVAAASLGRPVKQQSGVPRPGPRRA